MKLCELPGLGVKSEQWLKQVGIETEAELRSIGAVGAYLRLQQHPGINPSLNFLYAMVGALEGRHWAEVAKTDRERLLFELEDQKLLEAVFENGGPAEQASRANED